MYASVRVVAFNLDSDVKDSGKTLLEISKQPNKVVEVFLMLNLWILEQFFIESAYQDKYLAPLNVDWISDYVNFATDRLRRICILIVHLLHDAALFQAVKNFDVA